MKKITAILLLSLSFYTVTACDICLGSVSNYNPLLYPHLSKSFIGLNYSHLYYHTHNADGTMRHQYYNTLMLVSQYRISSRVQASFLLPMQSNELTNEHGTRSVKGLGDISLLVNFKLWNHSFGSTRHTLMVAGGVKLPTGESNTIKPDYPDERSFRLGTGSTDILLNASYQINYQNWVFRTVGNYKMNTPDKEGYRMGDVLNTGITTAYIKEAGKISIAPYLQLMEEVQRKDADHHAAQPSTGDREFNTTAGIDVNTKNFAIGVNYQFTNGNPLTKPQVSAHLSFLF